MTVDLACGDPAFLDLTFVGLDALPAPGEERHARDLLRTPGGAATIAIGAARLGMSAALAMPLGADADGAFLRAALEAEGVACSPRTVDRTAVTAVVPWDGERAMLTFDPSTALEAEDVAAFAPRAVALSVRRLHCAPAGATVYALVGDAEARAAAGALGASDAADALILNAREAMLLTGAGDPAAAARALAERVGRVVVTLGADGALAVDRGELVEAAAPAVDAVDTTGAGDLFTAAFIWSDQAGAPLEEALRWACLAASLSVRVPTALAGAQTYDQLVAAGTDRGLAPPARQS
ncbi:MAG TPA: carbohydrate kinase family protein [Solirubrobacteraceae bacterium]|jgi:sugar/nucleoside kinase (ribokinase family)|nr:carbohydrate kinase family protein [Solirubrobacteraceae bacterium]